MSDIYQSSSGTGRWDRSYRIGSSKPIFSNTIELKAIPESTVAGYRRLTNDSEVEFGLPRGQLNLRIRKKMRNKQVSMEQLDRLLDHQENRLDGYSGGDGGYNSNPNKLMKDQDIAKEVKSENEPDDAQANNINFSGPAGNFQGGHDRLKAIGSEKYKVHQDPKKKSMIRLVKSKK